MASPTEGKKDMMNIRSACPDVKGRAASSKIKIISRVIIVVKITARLGVRSSMFFSFIVIKAYSG